LHILDFRAPPSNPDAMQPHDLARAFAILSPAGAATVKSLSPDFYAELDRDFDGFKGHVLISQHSWDAPWPTWEMHPHGDELVYLIAGDSDLVLWRDGVEEIVRVDAPGQYVIIPQGVWHTARPHAPTTMLFVTPGAGTRNATRPD
jgi:mannose-6-phosphate isomerase-like protein (cupin superfamily)